MVIDGYDRGLPGSERLPQQRGQARTDIVPLIASRNDDTDAGSAQTNGTDTGIQGLEHIALTYSSSYQPDRDREPCCTDRGLQPVSAGIDRKPK